MAFHPLRFSGHAIVQPERSVPPSVVASQLAETLKEKRVAAESVADGEVVRFNVGWGTHPLGEVRISPAGAAVRADYTVVIADTFYTALSIFLLAGLGAAASVTGGGPVIGSALTLAAAFVVVQGSVMVWQRVAFHDRISKSFVLSVRDVCARAV